jgi:hypothetical protein
MKAERDMQNEKIDAVQKEVDEQKLLHLQLREEVSNELRSLSRKNTSRDKDINMLKFQNRISTKKMTFEMENLKWEMRNMTSRCKQSSYRTPSVVTTDDDNMNIHGMNTDLLRDFNMGGESSRMKHNL